MNIKPKISIEKQKALRARKSENQRNHRIRTKQIFGYSHKYNAQIHDYRILEKLGKLTAEEKGILARHREGNNRRNREYNRRKKINQSNNLKD